MSGKTRIVETEGGEFMPQFWRGRLNGWRFLIADADTAPWVREVALEERDPSAAARFASEAEAQAFLDRFDTRIASYWARTAAAEERARQGVQIKRVVRDER